MQHLLVGLEISSVSSQRTICRVTTLATTGVLPGCLATSVARTRPYHQAHSFGLRAV